MNLVLGFAAIAVTAAVAVVPPAAAYEVTPVENGGSVSGVVKFANEYPPSETTRIDKDSATCGVRFESEEFVVDPESKGLANVVAILEGVGAGKDFPDHELVLDQVGCRYEPHVQVGYATSNGAQTGNGTPQLVILNSDDVFHNVHAYAGKGSDETVFNTPSIPEQEIIKEMNGPGVYEVKCDVHAWMSAWIVLVEHPYVAISTADGTFEIGDVPPGAYTLRVWHEGLGELERAVEVTSGEDAFVDVTIGG